jgi:hypothetical protein
MIYSEPADDDSLSDQTPETPVTIKQMKENLEGLKSEKEVIDNKWEELDEINGGIIEFLRQELSPDEVKQIQAFIKNYKKKEDFYEKQLKDNAIENYETTNNDKDTAAVKENFISYKLSFFKKLVPFINIDRRQEYLSYIKSDLVIEKKDKDLDEKIYKQEEIIEERVDTIKEKIIEHKRSLEERLEKIIRKRISQKIGSIFSSEKAQSLSNERKAKILKNVLAKLLVNQAKLESQSGESEYIRKRIEIFEIIVEVVEEEIEKLLQ